MQKTDKDALIPLVTVVIPCYNHARFLSEAIVSVQQQTYPRTEIIVIDDGSTDDTATVCKQFADVVYHYQANAGLSAARNKGIDLSRGEYILFLDADDYLYPDAIRINLDYLRQHPDWAFASGWHDKVDEWRYPVRQDEQEIVTTGHYKKLLQGNYIGMHATVMYTRQVLHEFRFDTSLKACEDYDLYLRITRKHAVGNHSHKIAGYRLHGTNMSGNIPFMAKTVQQVLERQQTALANASEREAFLYGQKVWKHYYALLQYKILMRGIRDETITPSREALKLIGDYRAAWLWKYTLRRTWARIKSVTKKRLPDGMAKLLHRKGLLHAYTPPVGKVAGGDFYRTTPFSFDFGFDRGGPVDRYYIESFLRAQAQYIRGCVLEIGDPEYTTKYGGERVTKSDILHIDARNPQATIIGDLSHLPNVADNSFDCIILTQTLHFIYDFRAALRTCHRILKPGGCLLLTVPGISHIDHGEWKDYWLWSFTDKSMRRLMAEVFPENKTEIETFGNVYVATAFLYGMGLPEVDKKILDQRDPAYQVIISVKGVKP